MFDPNDIRLEFSCQPSNGEGEPMIVPQVTQTKDEALRELKTLTGDKGWLDKFDGGQPSRRRMASLAIVPQAPAARRDEALARAESTLTGDQDPWLDRFAAGPLPD